MRSASTAFNNIKGGLRLLAFGLLRACILVTRIGNRGFAFWPTRSRMGAWASLSGLLTASAATYAAAGLSGFLLFPWSVRVVSYQSGRRGKRDEDGGLACGDERGGKMGCQRLWWFSFEVGDVLINHFVRGSVMFVKIPELLNAICAVPNFAYTAPGGRGVV